MARSGIDFLVVYLSSKSKKANWGDLRLSHPHVVLSDATRTALEFGMLLMRTSEVRVIVCFGHRGPIRQMALLVARFKRLPIVARTDSNVAAIANETARKLLSRRIVYRTLYPRRTRVWAIGESNRQYWERYIGRRNIRLIPYSTPALPNSTGLAPAVRDSDTRNLRFLFVGRLVTLKRVDVLIEAFKALTDASEERWSLEIVGDGPAANSLRLRAKGDDRIRFHGAVSYDNLDVYYLNCDVLVLCSDKESWGLVTNEALAFGLWTVVSDQVGSAELITRPDQGQIFPAGDASALTQCLRDASMYPQRRPVTPYDPTDDMIDDLNAMAGGDLRATH